MSGITTFATRQSLRAYAADKPEQIQHQAKIICMQLLLLEGADPPAMRSAIAKSVEFLAQSAGHQAA